MKNYKCIWWVLKPFVLVSLVKLVDAANLYDEDDLGKATKSKASIVPVTKEEINREWKQTSNFHSSLIKSTSNGKLRGIMLEASLNRSVSAFL